MLKIAAELRYSETAFIRRHSANEFTIRYFTPKAEVELCGHATIASFFLLHQKGLAQGQCLCHTLAGDLNIEAGKKVMMQMAKPRIVATISDTEEIYNAIGIPSTLNSKLSTLNFPTQVVYAGLPDIMLPLPDVDMLQSLQPDMEAITAITKRYEAVSIHPFAFSSDGITSHGAPIWRSRRVGHWHRQCLFDLLSSAMRPPRCQSGMCLHTRRNDGTAFCGSHKDSCRR